MKTKQIGFVGLNETDIVQSIDNGPELSQPEKVADLVNYGYSWEGGYLYIDVDSEAEQQTINIDGLSRNASVDFFGGRPPTVN